jgi:hypothetical protein
MTATIEDLVSIYWGHPTWKFGDILVDPYGRHFMYLTGKGLIPELCWALALDSEPVAGPIVSLNRERFQRVVEWVVE